jgi:uncharacterized protein
VLRKNGAVIDAFGQIGFRPPTEWPGGGADDTLRRKSGFCSGDTNANDAFDASIEWNVFPVNTFDGLGAHDGNCGSPPPPPPPPPPPLTCEAPLDVTLISEIQGDGATSPLVGQTVVIDAVVTGIFPGLQGFYLQEEPGDSDGDPDTSEGVFVFQGTLPAGVGVNDVVRVEGTVSEFVTSGGASSLTQLTRSTVVDCDLPPVTITPTEIELPRTAPGDLEPFEGMLVTLPQSLVISEYFNFDRFGEVVLTSERQLTPTAEFEPGPAAIQAALENSLDRITVDDGRSSQNPDPADPSRQRRRVRPRQPVPWGRPRHRHHRCHRRHVRPVPAPAHRLRHVHRSQPPPRHARPVGGNVQVASFNVLNYFTTIDAGPGPEFDICGPLQNQDCRGADNDIELVRQRDKIVSAITAIDADIVGLIEIENNIDDDAVTDLVDSLNAVAGAGTYAAIETGRDRRRRDQGRPHPSAGVRHPHR